MNSWIAKSRYIVWGISNKPLNYFVDTYFHCVFIKCSDEDDALCGWMILE